MAKTHYMSKEKLEELKQEILSRQTMTRKDIASQLEHAKQLGDLSENFEYHDAKDRQAENEQRILELDEIIKNVSIVEEQSGGDIIQMGTTFSAMRDGTAHTFQVVGSNEADPLIGKISNESPMGDAFLGAKVGDNVEVETPSGVLIYKVSTIQ